MLSECESHNHRLRILTSCIYLKSKTAGLEKHLPGSNIICKLTCQMKPHSKYDLSLNKAERNKGQTQTIRVTRAAPLCGLSRSPLAAHRRHARPDAAPHPRGKAAPGDRLPAKLSPNSGLPSDCEAQIPQPTSSVPSPPPPNPGIHPPKLSRGDSHLCHHDLLSP